MTGLLSKDAATPVIALPVLLVYVAIALGAKLLLISLSLPSLFLDKDTPTLLPDKPPSSLIIAVSPGFSVALDAPY